MGVKLLDPKTAPKSYWPTLSRFSNNEKTPIIPPVLVEGRLISDFKKKAELFNSRFGAQCTVVNNTSGLVDLQLRNCHGLNDFTISEEDIFATMKNLNLSKAHGWDNISIRMIQLCGKSMAFLLKLPFWGD